MADKRFTLTVQNQPIDAILRALTQQLGLELVWREGTEAWRNDRVSLSVKNVTWQEVVTTVLQGHSATYRVQGRQLVITPAAASDR